MTDIMLELPAANVIYIEDLFAPNKPRSYRVPKYQRGYSWDAPNVEKLLEDFEENFKRGKGYYLIGQVILVKERNSHWRDIIDGQQRITTLVLLIRLLQHKIDAKALDEHQAKNFFHSTVYVEEKVGNNKFQPRFQSAPSASEQFALLFNGESPKERPSNSSEENLEVAYEKIQSFMEKKSHVELYEFLIFILNRVAVVELVLSDDSTALQVFSKINNRGLTLDDADLLKNLLFEKVEDEREFEELSENWEKASSYLFGAKLKRARSMEFLMKALIGIEKGKSIRSDEVYEAWRKELVTDVKARDFANSLPKKAKSLADLTSGKTANGKDTQATFGSTFFKWVQHLEVLLAGKHLSDKGFLDLANIVEARVMLSLFSNEKNQSFEVILHPWSHQINKLNQDATRSEILEASQSVLAVRDMKLRFDDMEKFLSQLSYKRRTHHAKIRYLLARCALAVDVRCGEDMVLLKNLMQTKSRGRGGVQGYDLDHVFPKSLNRRKNWNENEDESLIDSVGNLVLLHPQDNRAQDDLLPSDEDKIRNFSGAGLWVNRLLIPISDQILPKRAESGLEELQVKYPAVLTTWGKESIEIRQKLYFDLFKEELMKDLGLSGL